MRGLCGIRIWGIIHKLCNARNEEFAGERKNFMCTENSCKRADGVSGPYVLIDTKNREYEVVDLGGENH